jgi:cytochrome P450
LQRRIGTDPEHFARPLAFEPDRWLARHDLSGHNPKAFMPFGGGPRFCPGRNLALLEIRVVLSTLVKHFEVELANHGRPIDELFAFTMGPTNLDVRFVRRR